RRCGAEDRERGEGSGVAMMRWALLACAMMLCGGPAGADERSTAVVAAFEEACVSELPNFAHLDAKAKAENLPINIDVGTPRTPDGFFNHRKAWMVNLVSGFHELSAMEARGPAGEVVSCAVTVPDALGEEVKQDLMRTLNLGAAEREEVSADG